MRKCVVTIAVAVILLFSSRSANAQTVPAGTPHSVALQWTAPSPVGGSGTISGYNVYKSVGGAAYVKINTALIAGLTTTDNAVASGQSVSYCASTVDSLSEESACSIPVTATVPTNPNPPTLSKPLVTLNMRGSNEQLSAKWNDAPGTITGYVIWNGTKILARGTISDPKNTGSYTLTWIGKPQPLYLEVFDLASADAPNI